MYRYVSSRIPAAVWRKGPTKGPTNHGLVIITSNEKEVPIDKINREIGTILGKKKLVDLDNPETEIIVLISDRIYLGISKTKTG